MSRFTFDWNPPIVDAVRHRIHDAGTNGGPAAQSNAPPSPSTARSSDATDTAAPASGAVPQADGQP